MKYSLNHRLHSPGAGYRSPLIIAIAGIFAAVFALSAPVCADEAAGSPPNVLLLVLDDAGWADTGAYGGRMLTPHLDKLAAEGIRFSNAIRPIRVCTLKPAPSPTSRHSQVLDIHRSRPSPSFKNILMPIHPKSSLFFLAVAILAGAGCTPTTRTAETPPNIVYIISDDHSWTDYGFMGHEHIETPHLDKLASQSAVFTRGYVPTALCRPALASLANGLYAHQHRISGNDPAHLPGMAGDRQASNTHPRYLELREKLISQMDRFPTVPKLLGEKGYLSHQSGKWWEGNYKRGGFTHGMTRGFPEPGGRHGDDGLDIGREGMDPIFDFIDEAVAEEKPFFIWYAPFLPHTPHNPPERLFEKYKAKGIESDHVARYYAMVEWFDETCGQLLDRLDEKGLAENTLVVYVGDNGWIQNEDSRGFAPRSKQSANEGGVRQPTMFRWPGVIRPGDRGEQLCTSVDIVPTALAAAGADIPENLPGYDLLPILKSGEPTPRNEVFGETFAHDVADIENPEASLLYRWVIDGKWKLLLTYDGAIGRYKSTHPREEKRPQLYNLLADPHENTNLASEHPEVVARLAQKIANWWPVTERRVATEWTDEPVKWD